MSTTPSQFGLSAKAKRTVPQPINLLLTLAIGRDDLISLAAGLVDEQTLPDGEVRRAVAAMLTGEPRSRRALQYGDTAGLGGLREALAEHLCRLEGLSQAEMNISADNVIVGSGSQQLLYIVTDILVDPGDIVITEWPSYFVYTSTLTSLGASVRAVEMDEQGMRSDALEALLAELKSSGELHRVKILYTCDYYQNPTGITLSESRREEILQLVRAYSTERRICVLEDAAYRELCYDEPAPRTLKSRDEQGAHVVLVMTFSKPFSPGLRTGYAVVPDELLGPMVHQKGNHDFGSSNFAQHVLLHALRSGDYARHVEVLRRRYRSKRDAMLAALERHLGDFEPQQTHWTRPAGGLYVYLTLPEWLDTGKGGRLWSAALAEGVVYVPGEYCYGPDPQRRPERNHLRLTFGTVDEDAIEEGVARLARAIRKVALTGAEGGARQDSPAEAL